jgi:hypothetical protein
MSEYVRQINTEQVRRKPNSGSHLIGYVIGIE